MNKQGGEKMFLTKKIEDKNGEIIVRMIDSIEGAEKEGLSIVEMVTQGCVIGFWVARFVDNSYFVAEFTEVHDRLTAVEIEQENLFKAISCGRKLADVIVDFYFN